MPSRLNNPIPPVPARSALRRLEPIIPSLLDAVHAAFDHGRNTRLLGTHSRARASLMSAQFEDEVRRRLGDSRAAFLQHANRFTIGFSNLLVRLKKVNADYRTRNYPTETSLRYDAQLQLPELPHFPRLTLGYRVSEFGERLLDVALIYAMGPRVIWVESLLAGPAAEQLPLRTVRRTNRRVRIRPHARPNNENTEEG